MFALRWTAGAPLAAIITLSLFLMMAGLIAKNEPDLLPAKQIPDFTITPKIIDTDPTPIKPKRPDSLDPPPVEIETAPSSQKPTITAAPPTAQTEKWFEVEVGAPVGAPIIRIAPPYPENCLARGAQGTVMVQFDVAADGSVVNPVILETADICFDRTVLKAVSSWKYPPAYRNGQPVPRYGLVEVFSFEIDE